MIFVGHKTVKEGVNLIGGPLNWRIQIFLIGRTFKLAIFTGIFQKLAIVYYELQTRLVKISYKIVSDTVRDLNSDLVWYSNGSK